MWFLLPCTTELCFKCGIVSDMERAHHSCIQCNGGGKPSSTSCVTWRKARLFFLFGWLTLHEWTLPKQHIQTLTGDTGPAEPRRTGWVTGHQHHCERRAESSQTLWIKENASKHLLRRVTITKFDGLFFLGDWKESKSNGALNGMHVWGDLSGEKNSCLEMMADW